MILSLALISCVIFAMRVLKLQEGNAPKWRRRRMRRCDVNEEFCVKVYNASILKRT